MRKIFFLVPGMLLGYFLAAQPYVDPFQVRYTHAFLSGSQNRATPFDHLWAGSDLPVKLREKTYLLLSPYYERWQFDSASVHDPLPAVQGLVFPVGLITPLRHPKWSWSVTAMFRSNGEKIFGDKTFQVGGATFLSYETAPGRKIRFGTYVNRDFFGLFVMPLLGADWRMDKKNYLFGLLPGRLTWEHQLGKSAYTGLTFRALTNSYRLNNGAFARVDDNQLSAFLDLYPASRLCLTLEGGYGIMRKLRTGTAIRKYDKNDRWGDGWFVKLSASWRIRFPVTE